MEFNILALSGWHWLPGCSRASSRRCFLTFVGLYGVWSLLNSWISLISSAIDSVACLVSLVTTFVYPSTEEVKDCYTGGQSPIYFPREKGEWESKPSGRLHKLRKGGPSLFLWAEGPILMLVWGKVRPFFICDFKYQLTYTHQTLRWAHFINLSKF